MVLPSARKLCFFVLISALQVVCHAAGFTCPEQPKQVQRDTEAQVNLAAGRLGGVRVGELGAKVKTETRNLLGTIPQADRVYLELAMLSTLCTAIRDSNTLSEREKLDRWEKAMAAVRAGLASQRSGQASVSSRAPRSPSTPTAAKVAEDSVPPPQVHLASVPNRASEAVDNAWLEQRITMKFTDGFGTHYEEELSLKELYLLMSPYFIDQPTEQGIRARVMNIFEERARARGIKYQGLLYVDDNTWQHLRVQLRGAGVVDLQRRTELRTVPQLPSGSYTESVAQVYWVETPKGAALTSTLHRSASAR